MNTISKKDFGSVSRGLYSTIFDRDNENCSPGILNLWFYVVLTAAAFFIVSVFFTGSFVFYLEHSGPLVSLGASDANPLSSGDIRKVELLLSERAKNLDYYLK